MKKNRDASHFSKTMPDFLLGTSGYNYKHWANDVFYPKNIPQKKWLEYYCNFFNTVELNVTFYRLLEKKVFTSWNKRTPENFVFAVKGSRFITHIKRFKNCTQPLNLFLSHVSGLKNKLGVILWQLPPRFHLDESRLVNFCQLLKKSEILTNIRHVFEFRHESWFCNKVYEILQHHNFCLCIAHSGHWPSPDDVITSDFVYIRFHGGESLYSSNYSTRELKKWSSNINKWYNQNKDIYVYFNNDACGYAVKNGIKLRELFCGSKGKI